MCQAKANGGLRCSKSARTALMAAISRHEKNPSPDSATAVQRARLAFLRTPQGLALLDAQGLTAQAEMLREANARVRRVARFNRPLSSLEPQWLGDANLTPDLSEPIVAVAYRIACHAHSGVTRKTGEAYVNHPLRVAYRLKRYSPLVVAAALLHDAVEDSDLEPGDLRAMGFPAFMVDAVDALSKREGEPYLDAVRRACANPVAILIKLADNLDNSHPEQLTPFTSEKRERQTAKYRGARELLVPALRSMGRMRQAYLSRIDR